MSLCPDFTKDNETCRKKWSSIYNDYEENKAMNMRSGSEHSEKCRWFQFVDEFMSNMTHVVSYAHASTTNPYGLKLIRPSDTNTTEYKSGKSTSKSSEPKCKDEILLERCIGEIKKSSKILMDTLKASDNMKIPLLISMQQTM